MQHNTAPTNVGGATSPYSMRSGMGRPRRGPRERGRYGYPPGKGEEYGGAKAPGKRTGRGTSNGWGPPWDGRIYNKAAAGTAEWEEPSWESYLGSCWGWSPGFWPGF
jgi:hypothetical protein